MTDIVPVFIGYLFNLTHYKLSTTKSWQSPISTNNACDIVIQCKNRGQRVEINTSLTLIRTLQQLHQYYIGSRNMKTNANTPPCNYHNIASSFTAGKTKAKAK